MKTKKTITVHNPRITEPKQGVSAGLYQAHKEALRPVKLKDMPPYFKKTNNK